MFHASWESSCSISLVQYHRTCLWGQTLICQHHVNIWASDSVFCQATYVHPSLCRIWIGHRFPYFAEASVASQVQRHRNRVSQSRILEFNLAMLPLPGQVSEHHEITWYLHFVDGALKNTAIVGIVAERSPCRSVRLRNFAGTSIPCLHEVGVDSRRWPKEHVRIVLSLELGELRVVWSPESLLPVVLQGESLQYVRSGIKCRT